MSTPPTRALLGPVLVVCSVALTAGCSSWTLGSADTPPRSVAPTTRVAPTFLSDPPPAPVDPRAGAVVAAVARALPALASDRPGRLLTRAEATCADSARGRSAASLARTGQRRFTTPEVPSLTLDEASRVVAAVTSVLCPAPTPAPTG